MKKDTHPDYQDVLFVDTSTGTRFVCGSTLKPQATEEFEGKEYPVYRVPVSSASHPLFTGSAQFVDTEGRVDKFLKRYGGKSSKKAAPAAEKEASDKQESGEEKPKEESKKKAAPKKAAPKKSTKK